MAETRLSGADFVRAIACLAVVAHHATQRIAPAALHDWQSTLAQSVIMGAFGVSAFFVLSGFLLARPFWVALDRNEPMPSLATYALRRAARILPGYWLALTVSFILSFTLLGFPFDGTLLFRYISGLLLVADFHWLTWFPVEFNGPLWSICCEITSYVLLPLGLFALFALPRILRGWTARIAWAAIIAGIVGLQLLAQTYLQPGEYQRSWDYGLVGGAKVWWPKFNPIGFFAIFALGALASGIQVRWTQLRLPVFDLLALSGAALAFTGIKLQFPIPEGFGFANIPYGFPWFPAGIALFLASVPSSALLWRVTDNPVTAYIARISFGIYVWHFLLMEIVHGTWQPGYAPYTLYTLPLWAWLSAGVLAASFAIATLSYYLFEAPIIAYARRLEASSVQQGNRQVEA